MKNNNEFDNILDDCLERILAGESVESCLEWYQDQADELRPLLMTVAGARKAVDIKPRREFRDRAGYEFQAAVREMGLAKGRGFIGALKQSWVALLIIVVLLAGGSGTVVAANGSLPGEPLYQVKLATESVRLALATSEETKAELYVKLTDRRVNEIIEMAERGDVTNMNTATDKLEENLLSMAGLEFIGGAEALETQMLKLERAAPAQSPQPAPAPGVVPREGTAAVPLPDVDPASGEAIPPKLTAPDKSLEFGVTSDAHGGGTAEDSQEEPIVIWEGEDGLKLMVANSAISNSQAMLDLLDDVDNEVREALYRAIRIAQAGYTNIISNID